MGTTIGKAAAARMLMQQDRIMIISHVNPDGDTLGSSFALYHALSTLGKRVCVVNNDKITPKYCFLSGGKSVLKPQFEPDFIVAVDVGDTSLFGPSLERFADRVHLCIDHHPSNKKYAKYNVIDAKAAAVGEIMLDIILEMRVDMSREIADSLYTAIATDSGCFQHSSTTATTLRKAAKTVDLGADITYLNNHLFVVKSKEKFELERLAIQNMRFFKNNSIAFMVLSLDMMKQSGASLDDVDGIAALPRQIEGVSVGVTMREINDGEYRVSARSDGHINMSEVCQRLGGGGHVRAAGCVLSGPTDEVIDRILQEVLKEYKEVDDQ